MAVQAPKRVLCIMDIAGAGRSSLAVVLPALAACGVQACPLPTGLFSAHTGGFGEVAFRDEAAFCSEALAHYAREGVAFDAVYTGYLLGEAQFALAGQALAQHPQALKIVDPALGDHGRIYRNITPDTVHRMARLCDGADLITPNLTESALLLGEDPAGPPPGEQALARRMRALAGGVREVLVTSAPAAGGSGLAGCGATGEAWVLPVQRVPQDYPGAGDLFTALLAGFLLAGRPLREAARRAADFVGQAARATFEGGGEVRHGLWFEPLLHTLRTGP